MATKVDQTAGNQTGPQMTFMHASVAKNTVHAFAMTSELWMVTEETRDAAAGRAAGVGGSWAAEPPQADQEEMVLRTVMLSNCDCDNVFDDGFVVEAIRTMMASRDSSHSMIRAEPPSSPAGYGSSHQASLAGRLV